MKSDWDIRNILALREAQRTLIYALAHLDRRTDADDDDDARHVLSAAVSEVDEKLQEATNRCKFKHCCDVCKHRWSTKEGYEWVMACPRCRKPGYHIDWEDPDLPRIKEMYERLGKHLCKACEHCWADEYYSPCITPCPECHALAYHVDWELWPRLREATDGA